MKVGDEGGNSINITMYISKITHNNRRVVWKRLLTYMSY